MFSFLSENPARAGGAGMEPSLFPGQRLQAGEPYAAMEPIGDKMFRKGFFPEGKALKVLTYILSQKYLNQQSLMLIFFSFFEYPKKPLLQRPASVHVWRQFLPPYLCDCRYLTVYPHWLSGSPVFIIPYPRKKPPLWRRKPGFYHRQTLQSSSGGLLLSILAP